MIFSKDHSVYRITMESMDRSKAVRGFPDEVILVTDQEPAKIKATLEKLGRKFVQVMSWGRAEIGPDVMKQGGGRFELDAGGDAVDLAKTLPGKASVSGVLTVKAGGKAVLKKLAPKGGKR